jgi:hypothetical protein
MRRSVHRILRSLGLHAERHRDLYADLARLLSRPVKCAIDGGAYNGATSRTLLKLFLAADVHASEPHPTPVCTPS